MWRALPLVCMGRGRAFRAERCRREVSGTPRGGQASVEEMTLPEITSSCPRGSASPWSLAASRGAGAGSSAARASRPRSGHVGTGDAPAQEAGGQGRAGWGQTREADRGCPAGGDAPNFRRSLTPISLSGLLPQPLGPPEAAQRGGRAGGRNLWTPLCTVPDRAPARHLLQPPRPGSRAGNPGGLRLRATPRPGLSTADSLGEAPAEPADRYPRPRRRRLGKRWSKRPSPRGCAAPPASRGPLPALWGKRKSARVCPEDAPPPI